jgi:hypothetical protein
LKFEGRNSRNPERGPQRIDHPALTRQVAQIQRRNDMEVVFEMEKATKNTIRFNEVLENELDAPKVGNVYIPKSTLGNLGWEEGRKLVMNISVM